MAPGTRCRDNGLGSSFPSSSVDTTKESIGSSKEDREVERGTLAFLWAPRRMDGNPLFIPSGSSTAGQGASDVADELISFALLHHLNGLTGVKDFTGERTPTLHGQVSPRRYMARARKR